MFKDISVGVLGCTGLVGRTLMAMLERHPWFCVNNIYASQRSAGKFYGDIAKDRASQFSSMKIRNVDDVCCNDDIIFSTLPSDIAANIESSIIQRGGIVVSNSSCNRMDDDVPLLIPEVNENHLKKILETKKLNKSRGFCIKNPNCIAIPLSIALKPLLDIFGISSVHVVTMQSISGAGFRGIFSMEIANNVIPLIPGEEEKIENEPRKILGIFDDTSKCVSFANVDISAQCCRVPITVGHTMCVSVKLRSKASRHDILNAWTEFSTSSRKQHLPSSSQLLIQYVGDEKAPQPVVFLNKGNDMSIFLGRLRKCNVFDYKFEILSHNLIRGAAGSALSSAELLVTKNFQR